MHLQTTHLTKLTITEVPNLDPVDVIVEDLAPGEGRATIRCHGEVWTYFWGSLTTPLAEFIGSKDTGYLLGKFTPNMETSEIDRKALTELVRAEIIRRRRCESLVKAQARSLWPADGSLYSASEQDLFEYVCDVFNIDDATYRIPRRSTDRATYVVRVIAAVRDALRIVSAPPALPLAA